MAYNWKSEIGKLQNLVLVFWSDKPIWFNRVKEVLLLGTDFFVCLHSFKSKILIILFAFLITQVTYAAQVTSLFGWRINPITHRQEFHTGIDLSLPYGYPVGSFFAGQVVWARPRGGYGNCVIVQHEGNRYTLYGHLSRIVAVPGQKVNANELIGYVGSTGMSTGPHLHLEYWVNGQYVDPLLLWQTPQEPVKKFDCDHDDNDILTDKK